LFFSSTTRFIFALWEVGWEESGVLMIDV
jgi:hypothetical protein